MKQGIWLGSVQTIIKNRTCAIIVLETQRASDSRRSYHIVNHHKIREEQEKRRKKTISSPLMSKKQWCKDKHRHKRKVEWRIKKERTTETKSENKILKTKHELPVRIDEAEGDSVTTGEMLEMRGQIKE